VFSIEEIYVFVSYKQQWNVMFILYVRYKSWKELCKKLKERVDLYT